jgi:hypothetical protein
MEEEGRDGVYRTYNCARKRGGAMVVFAMHISYLIVMAWTERRSNGHYVCQSSSMSSRVR